MMSIEYSRVILDLKFAKETKPDYNCNRDDL